MRLWAPWRFSYIMKPASDECIFCKYSSDSRDAENFVVYRSKFSIAVLNAYPYNTGHVMVAPIRHVPSIENLSEDELTDLINVVTLIVKALRAEYKPDGINIGANIGRAAGAGIEGHFHIHIVPRWIGDTNFMPVIAGTKVLPEDLRTTWERVRRGIKKVLNESIGSAESP